MFKLSKNTAMNRFYITTPLYYINDKPHLGTTYSTVLADVLKRYHQLLGYDSFLMTGTDEHGQKCSKAAKKNNMPVQDYCDKMAKNFQKTWQALHISYDHFFRTTSLWHKKAVQKSLQQLYDNNKIYESFYEGWYCASEEIFYTSKDLVHGLSPTGKEVTKIKEKNYFFKMSAYQKPLIEHITKNPAFIQPPHRRNEIISFLKNDLSDLCISRPKSRLSWGVEIPFDPNYVTYVWVDALLNYATGVGYCQPEKKSDFKKWWLDTGPLHLIGKDILLTHCVYWPCLLMALEIPLPKTILAHGWLLNQEGEKMSKSAGDVMDPLNLLNIYDADALRYFLIKDVPIGKDSPVSHGFITQRINEDLANNLGNLISRTTKMIHKHFNSQVPENSDPKKTTDLKTLGLKTIKEVKLNIIALKPHIALEHIIELLNKTNQFLEIKAPWKTIKDNKTKTSDTLRESLEVIYLVAVLLKPVLPKKMDQVLKSLSCPDEWPLEHFQNGTFPKAGEKIQTLPPLFPRIKNTMTSD